MLSLALDLQHLSRCIALFPILNLTIEPLLTWTGIQILLIIFSTHDKVLSRTYDTHTGPC